MKVCRRSTTTLPPDDGDGSIELPWTWISAHGLRLFLVDTDPVEPKEHFLLFGIARPAASNPARWFRGENLRPPLALAPSHVSLELVVVDQLRRASCSILLKALASSGTSLVRSRT